jgi:type 1 fimbriae regulatory protein FimE
MIEVRWPVHPKPLMGESLTCWLMRISRFYGLEMKDLLVCDLGFSGLSLDSIDEQPPDELVELIAKRSGLGVDRIWSMTGAPNKLLRSKNGEAQPRLRPMPPVKKKNVERRGREYLTMKEVKQLIDAANDSGNYGDRDALMILMCYRHALRVGEVVDLQWTQVDFRHGRLHVSRLKNGDSSVHFLQQDEMRSMRSLKRENPSSKFVFTSQRNGPLSPRLIHTIIARAGLAAGIEFPVHPHMLRHGKGYELAKRGVSIRSIQAYMGHKNIQHTAIYSDLDAPDLKDFGKDVKLW